MLEAATMLPLRRYLDALRGVLTRSWRIAWALALIASTGVAVLALHVHRRQSCSAVTVDRVTFEDDGTSLLVRAQVTNGTADRVFVYDQRSRGYHYDEGSGTLTAILHIVPQLPTGSSADCHVMVPSYREIPPFGRSELTFKLPRHSSTFVHGAPLRENPVASHVRVELGWSDEPLALHPGEQSLCTYAAYARLQARERGIAVQSSR